MFQSQADIDKPKCGSVTEGTQVDNYTFANIDEASSLWKRLWEEEGSGDTEAEWIEKVREKWKTKYRNRRRSTGSTY